MTPDKDRQARSRQKKADAGLVRLELWVKPEDLQKVKDYAAKLEKRRADNKR